LLYFCIVLPVNYGPQGKRFEGRTPVYIYTLVTVLLEATTSLGPAAQRVSAVASSYVQTLVKILLHIPNELEIYHVMAVDYPDMVPPPYESTKDIFCFRMERTVNAYRKLSINKPELPVSGVPTTE